jgi:hypothetical protein
VDFLVLVIDETGASLVTAELRNSDFAFLTVLMILTLYIGLKKFRHSRSRLIIVLYRDGMVYFMCLFSKCLSYILTFIFSPYLTVDYVNSDIV